MELLTASAAEHAQRRVAGRLLDRGLEPGDRIVLVAASGAALLNLTLAALRRAIVPVLLNPSLLPTEQDELIADAAPALLVRERDLAELSSEGGRAADLAPVPLARPMHYTSGTTGRPKGVWSGLLDEGAARQLVDEERDLWQFGPGDLHLVCSPLHHSAPVRFAAGTLLAGGSVLLPGRFDPPVIAQAMADHHPTTTFVAPAHLKRLLDLGPAGLPSMDSFRLIAHAGSSCPDMVKRQALAAVPNGALWEFYGSTEGQFTACSPDDWLARPGTVGRARPGRRLTVDDDGAIWCDAPAHARFVYWRDPEKTAAAWRDGAFTVGDLGRLDEDGFLFIDGRRNDLVISGGVNVYPAEVERVLRQMPGIEDVVVFGVDDTQWGQRVCAAVVGRVESVAVERFASEHLAPYKRPKQVICVAEIPVTATGKVRRSTIADALGLS